MKARRAIMIIETDFRDEEAIYPLIRLKEKGLVIDVATDQRKIAHGKFGFPIKGDISFEEMDPWKYDILILPGGNEGPDRLRTNKLVLDFVKKMNDQGKLIASICHGPWILISAKVIEGRKATGYKAIVDDLKNAGAKYVDAAVVQDKNIITSRHPQDLADFMKRVVENIK